MTINRFTPLLLIFFISACSKTPPPAALTEVVIDSVVQTSYRPTDELIGRLKANDDAEIKANISGYIKERSFKEGQYVEKDSPLFLIDPDPYVAELAKAQADMSRVKAAKQVAILNYNRGLELRPKGAISASEMDTLTSSKLQAEADVQAANADLVSAQVNLRYTRITAPFSGRIGISEYSIGDLVGPQDGPLTTLVNADPIKVVFQISESLFLNYVSKRNELIAQGKSAPGYDVTLELSNGSIYEHTGKIDYISNRVQQDTGTIEGHSTIANPANLLKPGQYVKVKFESTQSIEALFVPQAAIQSDQQGDFTLVVNSNNEVARRNVTLGDRVADKVLVSSGLAEGDNVIVWGLQLVRPGQKVTSKHIQSAKENTSQP